MEDQKIQILLSIYSEKTEEMRSMRDRVLQIGTGTVAFNFLLVGWIIQNPKKLSSLEVIFLICAVSVFVVTILLVLKNIRSGAHNVHGILVRTAQSLHLYEQNYFSEEVEAILPQSWQQKQKFSYFKMFEYLAVITGVLSIAVILLEHAF